MKKLSIQEILRNPLISQIKKKIAFEKWKFNQLPDFYRKEHIADIKEKIKKIKSNVLIELPELSKSNLPCYACGSTKFWKTNFDTILCAFCHPSISEIDVIKWIEI